MHQTQSETTMNRRKLLADTIALATGALGMGTLSWAIDQTRTHVTRLSPEQENFIRGIVRQNLQWLNDSRGGEEAYQTRTLDGAGVEINQKRAGRGLLIKVAVTDVSRPFTFQCPYHAIDLRERPLLEAMFDQARRCRAGA